MRHHQKNRSYCRYVYDGFDGLYQTQYPSSTRGAGTSNGADYEQLTYDAGGNVTSFRNRANESISFTYDALGRLTFKDLPGSDPDVTYSYDLMGRMTGASQSGTSLGFGYDALGRRTTETNPFGTYTSAWDLAGRRTRLTYTDGFYVDYDYLVTDANNKRAEMTWDGFDRQSLARQRKRVFVRPDVSLACLHSPCSARHRRRRPA